MTFNNEAITITFILRYILSTWYESCSSSIHEEGARCEQIDEHTLEKAKHTLLSS